MNYKKIEGPLDNEKKATMMRLGIIFFFGLGSVVGGYAFNHLEYLGFIIPALTSGVLFLMMLYFQLLKRA